MAGVAKASVATLLGPDGASVSKASVRTLMGPAGATVTKVGVCTLLADEFIPHAPPPYFDGKAFSGQTFNPTAERKAMFEGVSVADHDFENRTIIAVEHDGGGGSDQEFEGLGGTEMLTHSLVAMTLYGPNPSLMAHSLHGLSLLSDEKLHAKTLLGLSLIGTNKIEAKTVVGYSLIGPPRVTSRTPIKGPPRIEEVPQKPGLVATKINLPQPPADWSPEWARNFSEGVIAELSKLQPKDESTTSKFFVSPNGKTFEMTVDDDGNFKLTHKQG